MQRDDLPSPWRCGLPGFIRLCAAACALFLASSGSAVAEETPSFRLLDAVELALGSDPDIRIAGRQVDSAQGSLMIASGRFDTSLSAGLDVLDTISPISETADVEARSFAETVTASRQLRSGQTLEPQVSLVQEDGDPSISTGTFAFTVRQPLLRGRSPSVVTAEEEASRRDLQATELDRAHRISQRLLAVVNQYWTVRAAVLDLEILRATEARSQELLGSTRRLVEADVTPAAELIQLEADLISREANRIAGERALFRARQNLRAEIGLDADVPDFGLPSEAFPTVSPQAIPDSPRALLAEAFGSRADLAAERERLAAAEIRLASSRDSLKPRLDLLLTPSFTGLVEDDGPDDALSALGSNVPGLSASLSLSYSFPIGNQVAQGALLRASSLTEQQALGLESRRIRIGADVPSALDAVRSNAEQLIKLERAVELFERTLENEQKKLRAGHSILIDVLNQRDRLTSVQRSLVSARLALAQALVALRFETGTLVTPAGDGVGAVRLEDLTTVPLRGE